MQQIINFVLRNKTFLLFLLLFGLSLFFTIQSHSYHKSKFVNSANFFTGGIYKTTNSFSQYFNLKEQNDALIEENKKLRTIIFNLELDTLRVSSIDSTLLGDHYRFTDADVLKNSYSLSNNYLTINKGKKDNIKQDFGVITSKGIVGIVDNTSNNYATVLSVLSKKNRINAQLKKTSHIGSLVWDGKTEELVQLVDISKFAPVAVGDTIMTGGQSAIFPKGILIGKVESFSLDIGGDTYTINVRLFNDMTNIGHVYIIENMNAKEIKSLQSQSDE
ncbi:rod shape-determining protein MreC [Subsaxibacter sp. CAU 1640]|uniref:rod shape-determining protein MreC n=1 Tax=Subsaxibacter sp. CAU 1640 TaxID=2933271 RepID=UPI0020064279|nr:rod shape-determining protein MreC [Subsaxibacter sp. CAU 1640]MCK7590136.1 rod shape-determining protein MreC [Subsaxibacter sp. CAU 1640]